MESAVMTKYYVEPEGVSFPKLEEEVLEKWQQEGILSKVKNRMRGGRPFVFCEGPPTASGGPHIGHVFTRAVKDAFLRYHVMNGRRIVPFIAGWDCHGLPVELEVERSLGLSSKRDIEGLGVAEFNQLCRESVLRYKAEWERVSSRVGYWLDYANAYMTMSPEYVESVWWSLKQLYAKGLLTRGRKVVPYCPRCGTTLSTHEVALGFREVEDRFMIVKFRLKATDASLLVWTATPWTLVGNALLAVDREGTYLLFAHSGEKLVVSESRQDLLAPGDTVLRRLKGSELVGTEYEPVLTRHDFAGKGYKVVHSPEVARQEGTGIVSISPAYSSADFEIGEAEGIPLFDPIDSFGRFTGEVPGLAGKMASESGPEIMRELETRGLLYKWGLLRRSYPFCWRCGSPLIYKALDSWFVRTSAARGRMLELNEHIQWMPGSYKHGRFGNFLADAKDWAVSRSRYWGTPLPIWRCPDGHELCIGSFDELRAHSKVPLPEPFDPHRPAVDTVVLVCPRCGRDMRREEFVVDCWYDSGCAPFAQYHYPFENADEFDANRSADFISEGVDQTRGWFYTQLAIGTLLFDIPAFKSVLVLGTVLDEEGRKMSRENGNIVLPDDVFSSVGADAVRLFFLSNPVWQSVEFSAEKVRESMVGTLNTLFNVYAFFASNANAYGFKGIHTCQRTHDLDRWIVSRLNSTVKAAREAFESFELHEAVRAIVSFVDDLSGWYVRRSRRRFWDESDPQDRFSAHCTLQECLLVLSRLMAPVTPFFAEWLYRSMHGPRESVHLESYPEPREDAINATLEAQMSLVKAAVEAGRLARQKVNIKLRQPLPEAVIVTDSDTAWILRRFEKMIAEELNVKKVTCLESKEKMVQYAVAPNLRILGPKLKENAAEVSRLLSKVDGNELVTHLRSKGRIRLGGFDLAEEDVIISERERPGYSHAAVGNIHVYMALEVTRNLRLEGLAREVIRRIQHMRKELRLEFDEPVEVDYAGHEDIATAISSHEAHILHETHARALIRKAKLPEGRRWTIDGMPLTLALRRIGP